MNTLDIKITSPDGKSKYSLRFITEKAIELSEGRNFSPLSFMPELLEQVIEKLIERGLSKLDAERMVYMELTEAFGEEIAEETFRYSGEYHETYETLKAMWDTGMQREAIQFMTGRNAIEGDEGNLEDALDQLINEINGDIEKEKKDTYDGDEVKLDDIWNQW